MKSILLIFATVIIFYAHIPAESIKFNQNTHSNIGMLTGRVIDPLSREPLPGINITIKGTATDADGKYSISIGAVTDAYGKFSIPNVPTGNYTITVSFGGYNTTTIENIMIEPGKTTSIEIVLSAFLYQCSNHHPAHIARTKKEMQEFTEKYGCINFSPF